MSSNFSAEDVARWASWARRAPYDALKFFLDGVAEETWRERGLHEFTFTDSEGREVTIHIDVDPSQGE